MEQRSREWLELRRLKIGSSDAPVIMKMSPWKTPYQLWEQKLKGTEDPITPAMQRGIDLEPYARDEFSRVMGIEVFPEVIIGGETKWQMASLDGIDEKREIVVEIKCGGDQLHEQSKRGIIPDHYMCQMQHQISVANPTKMFYCTYNGQDINILEVKRNDIFISKMLKWEEEFWELLIRKEPPEMLENDYEVIEHPRGSELLKEYAEISKQEKMLDTRKTILKQEIIDICPTRNFMIDGHRVYKTSRSSYDYHQMEKDGIDVARYKKTSSSYWTISCPRKTSQKVV